MELDYNDFEALINYSLLHTYTYKNIDIETEELEMIGEKIYIDIRTYIDEYNKIYDKISFNKIFCLTKVSFPIFISFFEENYENINNFDIFDIVLSVLSLAVYHGKICLIEPKINSQINNVFILYGTEIIFNNDDFQKT